MEKYWGMFQIGLAPLLDSGEVARMGLPDLLQKEHGCLVVGLNVHANMSSLARRNIAPK